MLIEIHAIQNHAPSNLNRDDLGAPKTTMFGGYLRSRISSQCLKRSIRMSKQFEKLMGGERTRWLADRIAEATTKDHKMQEEVLKKAKALLKMTGLDMEKDKETGKEHTKVLVFVSKKAIPKLVDVVTSKIPDDEKANKIATIITIAEEPDIALHGRMLEAKKQSMLRATNTGIEAALQAAHAISTHVAHPEIDYFTAVDDASVAKSGAAHVDEALYSSSCFYKYFSIDWEQLVANLGGQVDLAAHTVGAFIRAMALTTPSGKQNSYAAHNPPDGILVEIKKDNKTPISYANAFVKPVRPGQRDLVEESVAQLAQYVSELDEGFSAQGERYWFSPGGRYDFHGLAKESLSNFDQFVTAIVKEMGFDWEAVQKAIVEKHDA